MGSIRKNWRCVRLLVIVLIACYYFIPTISLRRRSNFVQHTETAHNKASTTDSNFTPFTEIDSEIAWDSIWFRIEFHFIKSCRPMSFWSITIQHSQISDCIVFFQNYFKSPNAVTRCPRRPLAKDMCPGHALWSKGSKEIFVYLLFNSLCIWLNLLIYWEHMNYLILFKLMKLWYKYL